MTPRQRKMTQSLQASRQRTSYHARIWSEQLQPRESAAISVSRQTSEAPDCRNRSARKSSIATAIAVSLTLTACGSTMPYKPPPKPERQKPAAAMVPCLAPSVMATADLAAIVAKLLETAEALRECSSRHHELVYWIGH